MRKAGGRPKDKIWKNVTKEKNGKWKCKHCGHEFCGNISATRIRAHIDKVPGKGIAPCSVNHGNEGDHNNMASGPSNNPQEHVNTLGSIQVAEGVPVPERIDAIASSSIHHQNNIDCGGIDGGSNIENTFECKITLLNQLVSDLQNEKSDIEGQVQWLQRRGKKRKRGVDIWLDEVEKLRKSANELNNVVHPRPEIDEIKRLIGEIKEHKENVPLVLSTEIVGESFEENIKKMWKLLSDDQVFIIGVYGMGGVGKTLLATHLENEIKRKGSFKNVFWVTVSHNFSTSKLQHDIAKRMGVKFDEDDEKIRAEILSSALETKEKTVLILDDVWKYIDLEKVGIRRNLNDIKVIVTTRLKHVCQQMDCLPNNMIQILPLQWDEANELFKVKLGHNGKPTTLPPEVEKIATCIAKKCDGLPLGISVMARTLKGSINDVHRWKHALNKLEKSEMDQEMEEEVFKVLKCSYDNLMEKDLQNCFLYCALFPRFRRREFILKLVDIERMNGRRSLEEIYYKGNTILDKLKSHSLLQEQEQEDKEDGVLHFSVSRFVIDMACNILKESQKCVLVKSLEEKTCEDLFFDFNSWILPKDQRDMYLPYNNQWICLCEAFSFKATSSLNKIEVYNCKQLKSVFCLSGSCIFSIDVCNLERLHLINLESLTIICKEDDVGVRQSLSMRNRFPCLTYLHISGCHEIKKLLTPWLILQLPNLEIITVEECDSMEEIIAVDNGGDNDGSCITLLKLTTLKLECLPRLKTVCRGYIKFPSSLIFTFDSCPNLERDHPAFPLQLDRLGNNVSSNNNDSFKKQIDELPFPSTTSMCSPPSKVKTKDPSKKRKEYDVSRDPSYFEHVDDAIKIGTQNSTRQATQLSRWSSQQPSQHDSQSSCMRFMEWFSPHIHPYIDDIINVVPDGNCGYRAVAALLGMHEDDWFLIRRGLSEEISSHVDLYSALFGERLQIIRDSLHVTGLGFQPVDKWMMMPDMGYVIATTYNVVLVSLSTIGGSWTFFPLRGSYPAHGRSVRLISIGFVNHNHWVQVKLRSKCPLPPIGLQWAYYSSAEAASWKHPYTRRIQHWLVLDPCSIPRTGPIEIISPTISIEEI